MKFRCSVSGMLALFAFAISSPGPVLAGVEEPTCRVVRFDMVPSDDLQMVIWIEDEVGTFVDTIFITRATGTYGLGNRPGIMEFNSGPLWPYGRRTTTFPVWTGRHGEPPWPQVIFQNSDDDNLSHPLSQSSRANFYCRPFRTDEAGWDSETCATTAYTDKGMLDGSATSLYPPRSDLTPVDGIDDPDVAMMSSMNPFDTVSRATPPGGQSFEFFWSIPDTMPAGNYVAWIEVAKEFDQNASYDYPSPVGIPWSEYGIAYRGQPSVLYRVAFTVDASETVASALEYAGYGDPDGLDHELRVPDATITSGVAGSGASRLLLVDDGGDMFRVRLTARPAFDAEPPGLATELMPFALEPTAATISFVEPGDDGMIGPVVGYEVRYLAGREISDANFSEAMDATPNIQPEEPGSVKTFELTGLLPSTNYSVGIRAIDDCANVGPVAVLNITTPRAEAGEVDACFVATAAYGSLLANEVEALRSFRDRYLRSNVPGELLVESYYTFGPALAKLIAPSDTLRRMARAALGPTVDSVRRLAP